MERLCDPDDFAHYKKSSQGRTRLAVSRISVDTFMQTLTEDKTFDMDAGYLRLKRQPSVEGGLP